MLNKPKLTESEIISNDGFWLDLDIATLIDAYGTPSEFEQPLIKENLVTAILDINFQLEPVKNALVLLGFTTLENYIYTYPNPINDTDALIVKYSQAVFCYCIASLLLQFKTVIRKNEAENMAKESEQTADDWLKKSNAAVLFFFNKFLPNSTELPVNNASVFVGML